MTEPILALDFDGVICDSVEETAITGWRAAGAIWRDIRGTMPPADLLAGFRRARPIVEVGYEAILMMRLLRDGEDPRHLLATFSERIPEVVARAGMDAAGLTELFGATRDRWLAAAPDRWVAANPFYPGLAGRLVARLSRASGPTCYIVTTKQRRFVEVLLSARAVPFHAECIHGLEAGRPKEAVLAELVERHPGRRVCFIEDRFATLERCLNARLPSAVEYRLAGWGYNTIAERQRARSLSLPIWALADLLHCLDQESHLDQ
ncbi:hypothetical protein ABC977_10550 [Thioalkalicoccus limnaeus]|uniref:Haloacid dehalogenase n=1 Tax=Thioalkalicoccus limnaeus TaxID=120681 RepID=A0ABV4BEZ7_9GAMM